jgi:hypothetical protein
MQVLFDQGTPVPLRNALCHHVVETAYERGWQLLTNGELLEAAEAAGFELLVTMEQASATNRTSRSAGFGSWS